MTNPKEDVERQQTEEVQRQKRVQALRRFIGEQCRRMEKFEEVEKRE